MARSAIGGGAFITVVLFLAFAGGFWAYRQRVESVTPPPPPVAVTATHPAPESGRGFLYGRVTTVGGVTYEGRLRWGAGEEAFWSDWFNGWKEDNPWAGQVPPDRLTQSYPVELFGMELFRREHAIDLERPFMVRFGDITRLEAVGSDVRVTLKSGAVLDLDRFNASDFDDGVRVWDRRQGVVDLDSLQVRTVEFLPAGTLEEVPYRLYGTVSTAQGDFTGFILWDRKGCVGTDRLQGEKLSVRFDSIRSISKDPAGGIQVLLLDGTEVGLSSDRGNRGIHVDDPRYGRVLIDWDIFMKAEFAPGGSGPAYDDFLPGRPLTGSVTTRGGDTWTGRLVFDLDESETVETLDAPLGGVDYTIPFERIASMALPGGGRPARVALRNGLELELEPFGDLGEGNAGILVLVEGREQAEYVPWIDVGRIDLIP